VNVNWLRFGVNSYGAVFLLFPGGNHMVIQQLAVHRTIVAVDVEGFGNRKRTDHDRRVVRNGLYRSVKRAFHVAGVSWRLCYHNDSGDGVLILAPPQVPKGVFAEILPRALAGALAMHNRAHPGQEQIRLRLVLHAGEVSYDEHGVSAAAINLAFRLLNAAQLKTALAGSPGPLAVVASTWFFEEVIRHVPGAAGSYREEQICLKETRAACWIALPDPGGDTDVLPGCWHRREAVGFPHRSHGRFQPCGGGRHCLHWQP